MARLIKAVGLLCFAAAMFGCELPEDPKDKIRFAVDDMARDYRVIVVAGPELDLSSLTRLIGEAGGTAGHQLEIINGVAATLPGAGPLLRLAAEAGIIRLDPDVEVRLVPDIGMESIEGEGCRGCDGQGGGGGGSTSPPPPQETPWGITRVGAPDVWGTTRGAGVIVAVIDTGIDPTHSDLSANILAGVNFTSRRATAWGDDNGHGSHVAGTVAALDNAIGVVGVAPAAKLYAVKVLDRNGSGYLSDVVAGINWSVQNGADILSMSLGTSADIQSMHDACDNAAAAGTLVVAAAGNSGDGDPATDDVGYPAKYGSVVAVAATDVNDALAYFSSDGPDVELSAPGLNVKSTWKGGGYRTISGTSMATPHVSGLAALLVAANPAWTADCLRGVLSATATDLGDPGRDVFYGYGLVNAPAALAAAPGACGP
ncbi:S8 family peptidase [Candidatus Uhrbacteria bacterium]|nr:S8 family peptidase [Candidatus Uhrbacteria bacterium]